MMIYDKRNVKQLKLVSGEEVLCEIVEEDEFDLVVRNVLQIHFQTLSDGSRMWTFKIYMCYQQEPERFILLKTDKIIAVANPTNSLLEQYIVAIEDIMSEDDFEEINLEGSDSDKGNILQFPTFH
jgi:hypothetical protein